MKPIKLCAQDSQASLEKGEMGAQEDISYEKENSCNIIDIDVAGIACNRLW